VVLPALTLIAVMLPMLSPSTEKVSDLPGDSTALTGLRGMGEDVPTSPTRTITRWEEEGEEEGEEGKEEGQLLTTTWTV